jgi:hypothetical protein
MNSRSKLVKTLLAFAAAFVACAFGGELIFELSEVTSREWKTDTGMSLRFIKLEGPIAGRFHLAIAHYGPSSNETRCLDFYEFRAIPESTNAHLRLLEHDIREGQLVKMNLETNANEVLISVTREHTNSEGKVLRNQYGYRLSHKQLTRTTEDFVFLMDEKSK